MRYLIAFMFSLTAHAACDFPVPNFKIAASAKSGVAKSTFTALMNELDSVWKPVFASKGCRFVLHRNWIDGTVNAQAWQDYGASGLECHVEMFGGLARYPGMDKRALRLVALHEIGHHLGGFPFYAGDNMSCEGQADYFAGAQYNSAAAALGLSKVFADLEGSPIPWRPGPALPTVRRTDCSHPAAQCRLVTYDAGRLHRVRPGCWYR